MSNDLRRAVAALSTRERTVLQHHSSQAATKWSESLPRLGAVWQAFAALVDEINDHERARQAANQQQTAPAMRYARRQPL